MQAGNSEFLIKYEKDINLLQMKILWTLFVIGFGSLALFVIGKLIDITMGEYLIMVGASLAVFIGTTLFWYYRRSHSWNKYFMIATSFIVFTMLIHINEINLAMTQYFMAAAILSLLYFNFKNNPYSRYSRTRSQRVLRLYRPGTRHGRGGRFRPGDQRTGKPFNDDFNPAGLLPKEQTTYYYGGL